MSETNDEVAELFARVARCRPAGISRAGLGFRFAEVRYANEDDLLSGAGASDYGGRWNPPGTRAIYLALAPETATRETYQAAAAFGFAEQDLTPRVLVAVRFSLKRILDLTAASVRRRLGFTERDLIEEDWRAIQSAGEESWTQAIGRGCREGGFEAILTPSACHPEGRNLVVYPDSLLSASRLTIVARDKLPPARFR